MKRAQGKLESPDTLLGQLQRGQGRGYLAARADKDVDALLHCIHNDPRWDRQVESRAPYYARLAIELRVDIDAIASRFEDDELNLMADVLSELGARGVTEAHDALRAALRSANWRTAARTLNDAQIGCDIPLVDQSDLSALMERDALLDIVWDSPEWRMWAQIEPRLKPMLRPDTGPATWRERKAAAAKPDTSMSTAELLAIVCDENLKRVVNVLAQRRDAKSVAAVREAGLTQIGARRRAAFHVLGRHNDPSLVGTCEARLETMPPSIQRSDVLHYFRALSAEHTLPMARRLLGHDDFRGVVALRILAMHAKAPDREALESELVVRFERDDQYAVGSLAEALGVIAHPESADALVGMFEAVPYSYIRERLLNAIHRCSAPKAKALSPDALYDCEPATRRWAAIHAEHSVGVDARLRELADDDHEPDEVWRIAKGRLNGNGPAD